MLQQHNGIPSKPWPDVVVFYDDETALDARLEVGLEQQAELMLKMMATLQADSILQALTSNSSTGNSVWPKQPPRWL